MQTETVPLDRVKPYWRNPRRSDRAVAAVAESIKRYGFNTPVVVDREYVIIAGHTRVRAARLLGLEEVPVVVADLPAEKAKAYRIADNATGAIAKWDYDALAKELLTLETLDDMGVFFREGELAGLLSREDADTAVLASTAGKTLPPPPEDRPADIGLSCPHCSHEFTIDVRSLR
jgi:ParB-like chromosome segregation protein Spo0J